MSVPESSDEINAPTPDLQRELEILRTERDQLLERQRKIAELLKCATPEKILHDLRNVLNELQLLKLLAETDEP